MLQKFRPKGREIASSPGRRGHEVHAKAWVKDEKPEAIPFFIQALKERDCPVNHNRAPSELNTSEEM